MPGTLVRSLLLAALGSLPAPAAGGAPSSGALDPVAAELTGRVQGDLAEPATPEQVKQRRAADKGLALLAGGLASLEEELRTAPKLFKKLEKGFPSEFGSGPGGPLGPIVEDATAGLETALEGRLEALDAGISELDDGPARERAERFLQLATAKVDAADDPLKPASARARLLGKALKTVEKGILVAGEGSQEPPPPPPAVTFKIGGSPAFASTSAIGRHFQSQGRFLLVASDSGSGDLVQVSISTFEGAGTYSRSGAGLGVVVRDGGAEAWVLQTATVNFQAYDSAAGTAKGTFTLTAKMYDIEIDDYRTMTVTDGVFDLKGVVTAP